MAQRARPLTDQMAGQVSAYLSDLMEEERKRGKEPTCCVYNIEGTHVWQVSQMQAPQVRTIQEVSMNERLHLMVQGEHELRAYSGKSPFEVSCEKNGVQSEMYLDELTEYLGHDKQFNLQTQTESEVHKAEPVATPEPVQERADQVQTEQAAPVAEANDKFEAIREKAEQYHIGNFKGQLVGVASRLIRHRDNVQDAFVSVAIPWPESKNGLGYIDIPKDVFEAANSEQDMKQRKSFHIPLDKDAYGMWYVDKATQVAIKPLVPAEVIFQAYEVNRAEFRMRQSSTQVSNQAAMSQAGVSASAPVPAVAEATANAPVASDVKTEPAKPAVAEPKQREVPNIVHETVPDFGDELDFM